MMTSKTLDNSKPVSYDILFETLSEDKEEFFSKKIYKLACDLKNMLYLKSKDNGVNIYDGLYFPSIIDGKEVLLPFRIEEHKDKLVFDFEDVNFGYFVINNYEKEQRNNNEKVMELLLKSSKDIMEQLRCMNKNEVYANLNKNVPYSFRRGYTKSKYIIENQKDMEEAKKIYSDYKKFRNNVRGIKEISLYDYLNTAYLCYKSFFDKKEIDNLSKLEAYKNYADFRDGGMLDLNKNQYSKKAFKDWYYSNKWGGSHPFEIISGYNSYILLLYPPTKESTKYQISLNMDYKIYYSKYLHLAKMLIEEKIPFTAYRLDQVAKYLSGDMIIPVNKNKGNSIEFPYFYNENKDNELFKNIRWEKLKIPNFKRDSILRR